MYLEERLQVLQQQNEDLKERIDKNLAVSRSVSKFVKILNFAPRYSENIIIRHLRLLLCSNENRVITKQQ